jgi:hypothetical protein
LMAMGLFFSKRLRRIPGEGLRNGDAIQPRTGT